MKIYKEPTKFYQFVFQFSYTLPTVTFCQFLKNKYGPQNFGYDHVARVWRFNALEVVDYIKGKFPEVEIDAPTRQAFELHQLMKAEELQTIMAGQLIKKKTDSDIKINGLKGELFPYQKLGVEFFVNNNGRAILADTMGLGKSLQGLAYIVHKDAKRSVVIAPASVKYSWEKEVEKWTDKKALVVSSKTNLTENELADNDIIIINYDILEKFYNVLAKWKPEVIIVDEFHYIKTNNAKRTRLTKALCAFAPSVLLLSGTPLLSRPVELFNGLQIMDPQTWNNWMTYTRKYCGGWQAPWGYDCRGATNVEELKHRISRYFLRRTKEEVLKDLPPKRFIDIPVEIDQASKSKYEIALRDFREYLKVVKKKTDKEARKAMQAEKLVKLSELRQITTRGKIEIAYDTIKNIVDAGEKVVVFSVYNEPIIELASRLGDSCVTLLGDTIELQRKEVVDKFQSDPKVKVFLGGLKSAGVGITLTSASNVLFIDYSWVPADHAQAADRIHRIGQTADSVSVYQLYARNTIDDYMRQILEEKKEVFDKIIEGQETGQRKGPNLIDEVLKSIEKGED